MNPKSVNGNSQRNWKIERRDTGEVRYAATLPDAERLRSALSTDGVTATATPLTELARAELARHHASDVRAEIERVVKRDGRCTWEMRVPANAR